MICDKTSSFRFLIIFIPFVTTVTFAASVDDIDYQVVNNDNGINIIEITDCDANASGTLVIPNIINGLTVERIANGALSETQLTSIVLPSSVREIRDNAFRDNPLLETVYMPPHLDIWYSASFMNTPSLQDVIFPADTTVNYLPAHGFQNSAIPSLDFIPPSVTGGGTSLFKGNQTMQEVVIPDTFTNISSGYIFDFGGRTIELLVIPNTITGIYAPSNTAINLNTNEIWIGESFKNFSPWRNYPENSPQDPFQVSLVGSNAKIVYTGSSVNHALDGEIGAYNNCNVVEINSLVTTDDDFDFSAFINLESITFPDSLLNISSTQFANKSNLKSITFNGELPTIDNESAFDGIHQDARIYMHPNENVNRPESLLGIPVTVLWNIGPPVLSLENVYHPLLNEITVIDATPIDGYPREFTYQWYKDDSPIPSYLGGTSSSFNFTGDPTANGIWRIVVTNENGTSEKQFTYRVFIDDDGDGLHNEDETNTGIYVSASNTGTSPNNSDTDGDLLEDGVEVLNYGTNPNKPDSDEDTLSDSEELNIFSTNPLNPDTDGDGFEDGLEAGLDPNSDSSNVNLSNYGLITLQKIQDLRPGSTIIEVSDNEATIQLKMEESSDLESGSWTEVEGSATMTVPVPTGSDTKFYRFKLDN